MTESNFVKAVRTLDIYNTKNAAIQQAHKEEIIEAFRELWANNPTESFFAKKTTGLLIQPEMLYIIATKEIKQ